MLCNSLVKGQEADAAPYLITSRPTVLPMPLPGAALWRKDVCPWCRPRMRTSWSSIMRSTHPAPGMSSPWPFHTVADALILILHDGEPLAQAEETLRAVDPAECHTTLEKRLSLLGFSLPTSRRRWDGWTRALSALVNPIAKLRVSRLFRAPCCWQMYEPPVLTQTYTSYIILPCAVWDLICHHLSHHCSHVGPCCSYTFQGWPHQACWTPSALGLECSPGDNTITEFLNTFLLLFKYLSR